MPISFTTVYNHLQSVYNRCATTCETSFENANTLAMLRATHANLVSKRRIPIIGPDGGHPDGGHPGSCGMNRAAARPYLAIVQKIVLLQVRQQGSQHIHKEACTKCRRD